MESSLDSESNNEYPIYLYIHLFFVFFGFLIYITGIILFKFFFQKLSLIKKEIFTFIIMYSFKSLLEILLSPSMKKEIIIYIIGIIEFYLIITYINKCLTSQKISDNNQIYEIEHKNYILFIFIIVYFPYERIINLTGKYIFSIYTINIILSILFFRYINIKIQLLLDYLKEKKTSNSNLPEIELQYMEEHYYYTQFNIINVIFYMTLIFAIIYNIIKILELFFEWKLLSIYLTLIFTEAIYCSLISGGLLFFFSINLHNLIKTKRKNEIHTFKVIDIDVQKDQDEISNDSKTKIHEKTEKTKNKKENKNEDLDNDDKEKIDLKISEETERLK